MNADELRQIIAEAAVCQTGDTCTLAGGSNCTCPAPINTKQLARVQEAAAGVHCGGLMVECQGLTNPRCEDGKCVADKQ